MDWGLISNMTVWKVYIHTYTILTIYAIPTDETSFS